MPYTVKSSESGKDYTFADDVSQDDALWYIEDAERAPGQAEVVKYGLTSGVSSLQRMVGGGLELAGELPFLDKVGEAGKGIKESANINEELARPENMTKMQELGASALGSAVSAAPFMAAGVLGGGLGAAGKIAEGGWKAAAPVMNRAANIALGGMAGGVGLEKYGELRGEGMGVGRSLMHGAVEAGAEFIGEKIPLKWALKALPEHKIASFLAQWFGREVLGEEVTTVLQNANAMAAGKDLSLSDWLQSMGDTAVVTAMLGPLQTAALSPVIALANKQVRDAAAVQLVKEIEAASKTPPPAAPEVAPEPGVVTEDNRPQEQPAPQPPTADEVALEEGEEVLYSLADTDALVDAARAKAEEMKAQEALQSPARRNFLKQLGGMAAAAAMPKLPEGSTDTPTRSPKYWMTIDENTSAAYFKMTGTPIDHERIYQYLEVAKEDGGWVGRLRAFFDGGALEATPPYPTKEAAQAAMEKAWPNLADFADNAAATALEQTRLEKKVLSELPKTPPTLPAAQTPPRLTAPPTPWQQLEDALRAKGQYPYPPELPSPALPQETTPPEANPADKYVADTLESYEASTQELLQRLNEDNQVSKRSLENLQGNYKNPNNGKRITSLPVTWSNNNKHKGPFVPSKLGDGDVVVVGEESDVFPSEYTHAVGKVVNWVNGKFFGGRGRFVIVLKSSTRRGPSSVSNHKMVMGTHYLQVPHALSLVKELTSGQPVGEYNAHRLASIYTSVFHELGHAIQDALFYEGLGRTTAEFLHHNTNDFDPIPQAIIDRIEDPLKRAVVQEYSDLKTQLFATNPAVPGVEFFKQWLGPAKYNYQYLYDWKVVSGEREAALLSLEGEVTVRDVVNRIERSTRGAAKWASFDEYFAEQLARWAYGKPKGMAQTAMGKLFSRVINEYASMLRGVFKEAKADGVFKPGVKFQDWLDSLTSVPTVDPKTLYKAPDDDTAKELKTDVELDDKLEKRKKGVKVRQERKAKQEAEQPITEDGMKKVMRAALSTSEFAAAWPGIKKAWDNNDPVEATSLFDIAMGNTKGSFNIEVKLGTIPADLDWRLFPMLGSKMPYLFSRKFLDLMFQAPAPTTIVDAFSGTGAYGSVVSAIFSNKVRKVFRVEQHPLRAAVMRGLQDPQWRAQVVEAAKQWVAGNPSLDLVGTDPVHYFVAQHTAINNSDASRPYNVKLPVKANLLQKLSEESLLRKANLIARDPVIEADGWVVAEEKAAPGTLILLDPPYMPAESRSNRYKFGSQSGLVERSEAVRRMLEKGAHVVWHDAATPEVIEAMQRAGLHTELTTVTGPSHSREEVIGVSWDYKIGSGESYNIEPLDRVNAWAEELGVGQVDQAGLNAEQAKNPKLRARAAAVWKRMQEKSPFLKIWFGNWEENIPDEKLQLFPVWNLEGQVIRDYATKPDVSHVTYLNGAPMVAVSTANVFYYADVGDITTKSFADYAHQSNGRLGQPTLLPIVTDSVASNITMTGSIGEVWKVNEVGEAKLEALRKELKVWTDEQLALVEQVRRVAEKRYEYEQNIDNIDPVHARKWIDYYRAQNERLWLKLTRAGEYIETIRAEQREIYNDPEFQVADWNGMPVYVNVRNPYYVDAGGMQLTSAQIHQLFFRATQGEHDALWVFNSQMDTGRGWFIIPFSTDQVKRMDSLTFGQRTGDLHFNIDETTPEGQGVADTLRILNAVERQERMWADSGKVPKTEYDPDAVATRALKTFKGTVYNRPVGRALLRFLRAKNAFLQFQQLQQLNPDIDGARAGISHARDYYRDSSGLTNMGQEVALGLGDLSKTETKALWDIREAEARGGVHWTKIVEITDRNLPSRSPAIKAFLNLPDSRNRGFIKFEHVPTEDTLERLKPFFDKQKVPEARREKLTQLYLAMKNSHLLQILFHKQEFLRTFMTRYEKASEEEKARQYLNVEAKFDAIIQRPYIEPSLFGNYLIQVFATIEGKKTLVWKEAHEDPKIWAARAKELGGKLKSGETLELKELTDKQYVLLAMPLEFLDDAARELGLTQEQVRTLESLLNPAKPDKAIGRYDLRHLQIPGGSEDLARAYSTFFWHQTNYIVKMKFRPQFRTAIGMVKRQIKAMNLAQLDPQLKAQHVFRMQGVLKALNESTDYLMHPTSELEWLRSFVSTAYLGFNLKTAMMNFYGVITTFSSITSEVGVAKGNQLFFAGMKIAFDSAFRMDLLRKKDPELADAIDAAVAQGVLSQSYAFALAGQAIANYWERLWRRAGDRIDSWLGGNVEVSRWGRKATRALINGGMAPFQMTERASRRVTFVIKYLEARELNAQAKAAGIPQPFPWPNDLSTYAARQTEILQNDYTRFNRPPVMRAGGPLGAIIPAGTIFLSFGQHMAFQAYGGHEMGKRREQRMFGENPKNWMAGYTTKIWLITLMVAGLKGLPGFENIFDILNGIYRKLFGKTAEQDIRDFVNAASNGAIDPLMVMYGLSHNIGGFDISRSIGFGRIVPGTDVLTRPTDSPTEVIGGTITSLMGPLGSMVYYMVRLGYDPTYSNFAKFPGGVGSMLQAWDWQTNGVRGPLGNRLTFEADGTLRDVTTAEVIGRAAGFRPEIVSRNQEAHFEMYDMKKYWQHRRANVFALMYEAHLRQDREAQADAREAWKDYNSDVPKEYPELRITPKDMSNAVFTRLRNVHKLEAGVPVERRYRRMQEDIRDSFNASARE